MPIQHVRCSDYVQITKNECVIDAKWNNFNSIGEATDFIIINLSKSDVYGFVNVKKDLWKYIP